MRKAKSSTKKVLWNPEKDNLFKELSELLTLSGYQVRREELKQGHGWKTLSGACRFQDERLIFVDKRLPQDEQLAFLAAKIQTLGISIPDERLKNFPDTLRAAVTGKAA